MSIFKRLICKWKGHDLATGTGFYCERCHQEIDYNEFTKDTIRERVIAYCKRLKTWWKCEECGVRFGKHDDSVDHIPF